MWIWITLVALALAAPILVMRRIARAKRKAFGKLMELRLEGLKLQVRDWKGSTYDLMPYDSDLYESGREAPWRGIEIRPNAATTWLFRIDLQKRYRLSVKLGEEEAWYPSRYGWSEEPWLKQRVDALLFQISQLPAPRTWMDVLEKQRAEHKARMAEYDREWQRSLAERQTIGGAFPSLDDPMDDMD